MSISRVRECPSDLRDLTSISPNFTTPARIKKFNQCPNPFSRFTKDMDLFIERFSLDIGKPSHGLEVSIDIFDKATVHDPLLAAYRDHSQRVQRLS
jgi:hypothetical protein